MKKIFFLILIFLLAFPAVFAEDTYTLKAGVALNSVPKNFYGTWRVSAKLSSSNCEGIFKKNNVDLWNLSRVGNVITLDNPFSGAHASITIDEVSGNFIRFKKTENYDGKKLTDMVQLNLEKETFKGINNLKLDTISDVDGRVIKTEWAVYSLTGEKISGSGIK